MVGRRGFRRQAAITGSLRKQHVKERGVPLSLLLVQIPHFPFNGIGPGHEDELRVVSAAQVQGFGESGVALHDSSL